MVALENHETYGTWCLALEPITKYAILINQTINVNDHWFFFFFTVLNLILKSKFNTKDIDETEVLKKEPWEENVNNM